MIGKENYWEDIFIWWGGYFESILSVILIINRKKIIESKKKRLILFEFLVIYMEIKEVYIY